MEFKAIAAISKNKGLGIDNKLPWKLSEDLKNFKKLTVGNANNSVVMGKNTWNSIKFLPNRHNYILSTSLNIDEIKNNYEIKSFNDLDSLLIYLKNKNYDSNWVIGGAKLYKTFFDRNLIDKLYITLIDKDIKCDTFMPSMPKYYIKNEFRLSNELFENKYKVYYIIYEKIKKNQKLIYKNFNQCTVKDIHYEDFPNIYITIYVNNKEIQTIIENLKLSKNLDYI